MVVGGVTRPTDGWSILEKKRLHSICCFWFGALEWEDEKTKDI